MEEVIKRDIRIELVEQLKEDITEYREDELVDYIYNNLESYYEVDSYKKFLDFIKDFRK